MPIVCIHVQEQLETVEQKKRAAILNRIQEQKDEEQMLERSKQEYVYNVYILTYFKSS